MTGPIVVSNGGKRSRLGPWRQLARSSSHCDHHELNVHAYYADLPIWDIVFGTFKNPDKFEGKVGFAERASFSKMLVGIDVNDGQDAGQPGGKLAAAV